LHLCALNEETYFSYANIFLVSKFDRNHIHAGLAMPLLSSLPVKKGGDDFSQSLFAGKI
jgi:hypothetical protein